MSDSTKPTLLIVDGHSLAFRAFYALPVDRFQTSDGQHTNAVYGFIAMFISLLKTVRPTHIAVAFDVSRTSFRTREYPEYKGTRDETPPEFVGQIPLLQDALEAMGVVWLTKEDYEADDILATLARQGAEQGFDVRVVSGDRDTIQLVDDDVTLLYPSVRGVSELKHYDRAAVLERYGVEPHLYPEVAALVGEASDNLIGITKVGEKTAVKWVNTYGTVDDILAHADEIKGVAGHNLREQRENALRNRRLNRLVTDVPLAVTVASLERLPVSEQSVRESFGRLEFRTLLDRLLTVAANDNMLRADADGSDDSPLASVPEPRRASASEAADWAAGVTGPVSVTVRAQDSAIDEIGLAIDGAALEVSWTGLSDGPLISWLESDAPKWLTSAKSQISLLAAAGVEMGGVVGDTTIAAWLLEPASQPGDLAHQVTTHLHTELPQGEAEQLVPEQEPVGTGIRSWYTHQLAGSLHERMVDTTRRVYDEIEMPLIRVLARMERAGIGIDSAELDALHHELESRADELAQSAYAEIGHVVNLGSPKQLQTVLFDELGMPKTRATKTGYSTNAAALADLQDRHPHPFLDLLLQHRDSTKLKQITETLAKAIGADRRIHTRYEQTGTSTGRVSSTDPNLQNIPVRTEVGRRIRSTFVASDGARLLTADYSQIEMRIMAHLSEDAALIDAFARGEDLHRFVGSRIFGVEPGEVTSAMRTKVKAMSYGLAYGLSAFGLSQQLRIPRAEATSLMNDYFERFGAVRDYLRAVVEEARVNGYTETIFGRRRYFPDLTSTNRMLRDNAQRAALNAPIQGAAADIIKRAMLAIASEIAGRSLRSRMLLQVHDELIFDVASGEQEELESVVRSCMSSAADLSVPLEVQVGTGPNWQAAAH